MHESGMIRVLKRDGSVEPFVVAKLAAAMWYGLRCRPDTYCHARQLAEAIGIYLARRHWPAVSSKAVFEMATKAFRHVDLPLAAKRMEEHRRWRQNARRSLRIRHDDRVTLWDKGWLCKFAHRSWHVSMTTARIIVGRLEVQLLRSGRGEVGREEVMDLLNLAIADYGLADAVPVNQY